MVDWNAVTQGSLIYSTPSGSCKVYRGTYKSQAIVLKRLTFTSEEESASAENEANLQFSLVHPHICRLLAFKFESKKRAVIMLESMEKDLLQEIDVRKKTNSHWTDDELTHHVEGVLGALECAQRMGVCHRDIKPQNIFVKQGCLYLADFGCAKQMDFTTTSTVKGSPYFFSPELKAAFNDITNGKFVSIVYNPYKSDVYSLGLTVLYMITFKEAGELMELKGLQQATDRYVARLGVGERVKEMVGDLLKVSAKHRMDFEEIQRKYFPKKAPVPQSFQPAQHVTTGPQVVTLPQQPGVYPDPELASIAKWLDYFFSTNVLYTYALTYQCQCYCCSSLYTVNLLSEYTCSYLYFCSQACYAAYYSTQRTAVCMCCNQQFYPSTDWHPQAQTFPVARQLSLSQICSYACFDQLKSVLDTDAAAPPRQKPEGPQTCAQCRGRFIPSKDWHYMVTSQSPKRPLTNFCSYDCYQAYKRPKTSPANGARNRPGGRMDVSTLAIGGRLPNSCSFCTSGRKVANTCSGFVRRDGRMVKHYFCNECLITPKFAHGCGVCRNLQRRPEG